MSKEALTKALELQNIYKKYHNKDIEYYNEHIAPLKRKENELRDLLPKATTKERAEIEKSIDNIQDTIKKDITYNILKDGNAESLKNLKDYIQKNLSFREKIKLGYNQYNLASVFTEEEIKKLYKRENIIEWLFIIAVCIMIIVAFDIIGII